MVFHLVDGPDGALDVLHSHEALVQRQVVPYSVLIREKNLLLPKFFVNVKKLFTARNEQKIKTIYDSFFP